MMHAPQTAVEGECVQSIGLARLDFEHGYSENDDDKIHLGFSRCEMNAAFNKVCDPDDWKNPIPATIDLADVQVTIASISFYTGSPAVVRLQKDGSCKIGAIGYYAVCGS